MSEASALLAVGQDFEYNGRKYHLRPFTLGDEAKYGAWREQEAYKSVCRQKGWMDPEDYRIALQGVSLQRASGEFDFKSQGSIKSIMSSDGIKQILLMTLEVVNPSPTDPPVDEELVDKLYEEKYAETIKLVEGVNKDPKVRAERRRARKMARLSAK